jgi:hypothetical protein
MGLYISDIIIFKWLLALYFKVLRQIVLNEIIALYTKSCSLYALGSYLIISLEKGGAIYFLILIGINPIGDLLLLLFILVK